MSTSRVRVSVDQKSLNQINKELSKMAKELRGPAMNKALKNGSSDLAKTARQTAKAKVPKSKPIHKSIQDVKGKYSSKTRPYRVIQHRDRAYDTERIYANYKAKRKTNWSKIGHLVLQGVGRGTLIAGTSVRRARWGRSRILASDWETGEPIYQRKSTTGKHFIVRGADGRAHPIKRINHGGMAPTPYFDIAAKQGFDKAKAKYEAEALRVVGQYREAFIRAGFRNT